MDSCLDNVFKNKSWLIEFKQIRAVILGRGVKWPQGLE